jgi:hypothetical protein
MVDKTSARGEEGRDTQLQAIRDLMLAASRREAWLTLGEIAGLTEIGEASISAQLRHLRKRRHGRHLVEKRRRPSRSAAAGSAATERRAQNRRTVLEPGKWEYRVLPPAGTGNGEAASCWAGQNCEGGGHAEARN